MTTVFISWLVFILFGLILGYAFYKEFSNKNNNPEYLKDYGLEPKEPEEKIKFTPLTDLVNLFKDIDKASDEIGNLLIGCFSVIIYLFVSVLVFGCLGILGYAVIIFLIKFVRSNLTL